MRIEEIEKAKFHMDQLARIFADVPTLKKECVKLSNKIEDTIIGVTPSEREAYLSEKLKMSKSQIEHTKKQMKAIESSLNVSKKSLRKLHSQYEKSKVEAPRSITEAYLNEITQQTSKISQLRSQVNQLFMRMEKAQREMRQENALFNTLFYKKA